MRNNHIGDSLDMSKRVLLHTLADTAFRPVICPLPSQREFNFDRFRQVLCANGTFELFQTEPNNAFWGRYRSRHLRLVELAIQSSEYADSQVFLLDPDNGIHRRDRNNKVLHVEEINRLVAIAHNKVIAVYHHNQTGRLSYSAALDLFPSIPSFAYDLGTAAILFFQGPGAALLMSKIQQVIGDRFNPDRLITRA